MIKIKIKIVVRLQENFPSKIQQKMFIYQMCSFVMGVMLINVKDTQRKCIYKKKKDNNLICSLSLI